MLSTKPAPVPLPRESVSKMENQRRAILAASGCERHGSVVVADVVYAHVVDKARNIVNTPARNGIFWAARKLRYVKSDLRR